MASESSEPRAVAVTLPPALDEWLAERAETADTDREELLVQLAAAYRTAAGDGDAVPELAGALERAATDAATERIDDRLGSFRSSLDSQLQAIRRRVVQLKHEADEKADRGRVDGLSTRVDGIEERLDGLDDLEESVETLHEEVETLRDGDPGLGAAAGGAVDRGAGRRDGPVVERELSGRLDDIESKLVRVARAVVELREGGDADARPALRELKRVAAREGVREADCAGCAGTVDIALLPDAACPHCDARFRELAPVPADGGGPRLEVDREPVADDDGERSIHEEPAGDGEGAIAGADSG